MAGGTPSLPHLDRYALTASSARGFGWFLAWDFVVVDCIRIRVKKEGEKKSKMVLSSLWMVQK